MNKPFVILVVLVALAVVLVAPSLASPAEASGRMCPSPGTGLAGALNMVLDPTMDQIMADHTADQGNAGMYRAVENSACD